MTSEPLHLKYRPGSLSDLKGQRTVRTLLSSLLSKGLLPHKLLFTGLSGVGKTTVARIIATELGCSQPTEVNAGEYGNINRLYELIAPIAYINMFSMDKSRVYIIDDCHTLTVSAWKAVLDPRAAPDVYFIFCTTEGSSLPAFVRSTCAIFLFTPLSKREMLNVLRTALSREKDLRVSDTTLQIIVQAAGGSARRALVCLAMVDGLADPADIRELLLLEDAGDKQRLANV